VDCGHGIANELGFRHLLLDIRQVQICVQQQKGVADSVNDV
jgi:hypothetical protein